MRALDSVWTTIRLRTSVRRYAMQVLHDLGHAPLMDPVTRIGPCTTALGLDPLRLLVFGGGMAIGYGVKTRAEAFDGPLVDRLAAVTGRGITLENRAVQHVHTHAAVESLGLSGAHTFHLAIWSPSFAEGLLRLSARKWRLDLARMIADLRQDTPIPLILMQMPEPRGLHLAAILARPWVQQLNRAFERVAADHPSVTTVPTPPFIARDLGQPVTDAAYFAAAADFLAPAVLAALQIPARETAAVMPSRA